MGLLVIILVIIFQQLVIVLQLLVIILQPRLTYTTEGKGLLYDRHHLEFYSAPLVQLFAEGL